MKPIIYSILLLAASLTGNEISFDFDPKLDKQLQGTSAAVIEAVVEIVKVEYRDSDGFTITDYSIENHRRMPREERAHTARYLCKFKDAVIVKGESSKLESIQWSVENNIVLMCPGYPSEVFKGARYRFYIGRTSSDRAYDVRARRAKPE